MRPRSLAVSYPESPTSRPRRYSVGRLACAISITAIVPDFGLSLLSVERRATCQTFFHRWTPSAALVGMVRASWSGLVHRTADRFRPGITYTAD